MAIEDMVEWDIGLQFDGAFSNFGGLNCVANLSQVAQDLARLVKPGGPVVLCLMSRSCLWEWVYYLGRLDFTKAFRRFRKGGVAAQFKNQTTFACPLSWGSRTDSMHGPSFPLCLAQGCRIDRSSELSRKLG